MTSLEYVVLWNGGPLLPDRPDGSSLPVYDEAMIDLAESREDYASQPRDPDGRRCACGCQEVLPKRARRRGIVPSYLHGHHRRGKVSPLKGQKR